MVNEDGVQGQAVVDSPSVVVVPDPGQHSSNDKFEKEVSKQQQTVEPLNRKKQDSLRRRSSKLVSKRISTVTNMFMTFLAKNYGNVEERGRNGAPVDPNNYQGVSLTRLVQIKDAIMTNVFEDVRFYELKEDYKDLKRGMTVRLGHKSSEKEYLCIVQNTAQEFYLIPTDLLREKQVYQLSMGEICEFLLDRDFLRNTKLGRPHEGVFLIHGADASFVTCVQSLENRFQATIDDTYVWFDMNCGRSRNRFAEESSAETEMFMRHYIDIVQRFDERMIFLDDFEEPKLFQDRLPLLQMCCVVGAGSCFKVIYGNKENNINKATEAYSSMFADGNLSKLIDEIKVPNMPSDLGLSEKQILAGIRRQFENALADAVELELGLMSVNQTVDDKEFAELLFQSGVFMQKFNKFETAIDHYKKALLLYESMEEDDDVEESSVDEKLVAIFENMAYIFRACDEPENAIDVLENIVTIEQSHGRGASPYIMTIYHNLGELYEKLQDLDNAVEMYSQVLHIQKETLDDDHPDLAKTLGFIAHTYALKGDLNTAISFYEQALGIEQINFGKSHPSEYYERIGELQFQKRDFSEAASTFEHYVELLPDEDREKIVAAYDMIARIYNEKANKLKEKSRQATPGRPRGPISSQVI